MDAVPENAFPQSPAQSSIWLAYQLNPGTSQSIAQCIEVHGELDLQLLHRAYVRAGHEFETLAVRLIGVGGRPYQIVEHSLDLSLELSDMRNEAEPVALAHEWMRRKYTSMPDLGTVTLGISAPCADIYIRSYGKEALGDLRLDARATVHPAKHHFALSIRRMLSIRSSRVGANRDLIR